MPSVAEQEQLPEADRLLDTLRLATYHGELTPGQRLVEADVASRYDASRVAVREALAEPGPSPFLPSTAWG